MMFACRQRAPAQRAGMVVRVRVVAGVASASRRPSVSAHERAGRPYGVRPQNLAHKDSASMGSAGSAPLPLLLLLSLLLLLTLLLTTLLMTLLLLFPLLLLLLLLPLMPLLLLLLQPLLKML